ncbi:MAG: class I SAM-dependent DNA methyltransferase [Acidobacteria bacterium]|nr:class I SAM-dependent DNA methyltransferase [Acidobacteriota bacterium]
MLSPNEIKTRAIAFAREWRDDTSEDAEAKSFWDAFFDVFGIKRRRVATFEKPVNKSDGKGGFIDLLWKGVLLVEHKSRGRDLDRAYGQARDYFAGLKDRDLPRYVIVSDFARIRLYDLEAKDAKPHEFDINDLHKHVGLFGFISGHVTQKIKPQDPVNAEAAEKLGKLHDLLKASGYDGHPLEVFLVRVLFCLFAEDNSIFEQQTFREWLEVCTSEDGSDLGRALAELFQILNTPEEKRPGNLDERLAAFRYINGRLFEEPMPIPHMDSTMREMLLDCCRTNWAAVSPAIFGALFQSIKDKKARRNLGEHYTSETNILKALQPLFLDDLHAEFERIKRDRKRLEQFHQKLAEIRVLDPACGCGNFLVIAYRELRLLELDVLRALFPYPREGRLDVSTIVFVDVDQFYGIEIEEFPAQIAQVAMWMTDHQMNQLVSEEFGDYFVRLPLKKSATIVNKNALRIDWAEVVAPEKLSYIVGNPPFVGKGMQSQLQKADMQLVFDGSKRASALDYVACWYEIAVKYCSAKPEIEIALVSTNSITQGEQVDLLWSELLRRGTKIIFAHRTFSWSSEASGKAAVHCVIVGFSLKDRQQKILFEYEDIKGQPKAKLVSHVNPYLVEAGDVILKNRTNPIANVPKLIFGSMPNDGGALMLTETDRQGVIQREPHLKPYIRKLLGAEEFINGIDRYCFWLIGVEPSVIRSSHELRERIDRIRKARQNSTREATRRLAATPTLFGEIRQPQSRYLLVPSVSSELRAFIPVDFMKPSVIANNLVFTCEGCELYHLGVISSTMHMGWVRAVCGRLKSDYRYSAGIVYNNFPWPEPNERQKQRISDAAQGVLDARAKHPESTLADLYDPLAMPDDLVRAHRALDQAVDAAYGKTNFASEAERVAFLFTLYEKLTSLFPTEKKPARRRART